MTGTPDVLFAEPGGRWRTVAYGPALCLAVLIAELITDSPVPWFGLLFCATLLAGFVALQVVAARRHASVELTSDALRNGTETVPLSTIDAVLPEADEQSWDDEPWDKARTLGELTGIPRRRTGIGLRRTDGEVVRAWARDHRGLRAALDAALDRPAVDPVANDLAGENGSQR